MTARPRHILPVIAISQFAGVSLWFSSNAILPDLQASWHLPPEALGDLTSATQFGFIAGTLVFAFTALADRISPRKIFLACALLGAVANGAAVLLDQALLALLVLRFATGFFLAGIYPVGMKIAAGWFDRDLGRALGYLVGALVGGTALPHLIRGLGESPPWQEVTLAVSVFAIAGGLLMFATVPDGPFHRAGAVFNPKALLVVFHNRDFRGSAFGYFGHMWELYAFWAFAPVVLAAYAAARGLALDISLWTGAIIATSVASCMVGGLLSPRLGSAPVAAVQLAISGLCCLVSPLLFFAPPWLFLPFLLVWGLAVAGDSPQFSALNARFAPPELVGSALTIANCIGFTISIVSIQLLNRTVDALGADWVLVLLVPGPVFGLWALRPLLRPAAVRATISAR
ncbi:MAG: MFS transporter [Alphaproteobacteria bacterium]|nr:MFS transporter [Alphaproteobacteria bacterium]MCB9929102.1 MFS transporter [Alphaproteobacteria bacterium]